MSGLSSIAWRFQSLNRRFAPRPRVLERARAPRHLRAAVIRKVGATAAGRCLQTRSIYCQR